MIAKIGEKVNLLGLTWSRKKGLIVKHPFNREVNMRLFAAIAAVLLSIVMMMAMYYPLHGETEPFIRLLLKNSENNTTAHLNMICAALVPVLGCLGALRILTRGAPASKPG